MCEYGDLPCECDVHARNGATCGKTFYELDALMRYRNARGCAFPACFWQEPADSEIVNSFHWCTHLLDIVRTAHVHGTLSTEECRTLLRGRAADFHDTVVVIELDAPPEDGWNGLAQAQDTLTHLSFIGELLDV